MDDRSNIFRSYTLDYLGIYHFYDEDDFIKEKENGEYILENLKKSNRFDYDGASYTFTKFNNISEGRTRRNVSLVIEKDDVNVKIDNETAHLDLIYKMNVKRLEDHYRVTTHISEKYNDVSALLYIKNEDGEDCVKALEEVKKYQELMAGGNNR